MFDSRRQEDWKCHGYREAGVVGRRFRVAGLVAYLEDGPGT